jgi:cyclic pyranopterin phosphate synthase
MPKEGVPWVRRSEVLSWEELYSLCGILADCGVRKIRVTGGEPLVRTGLAGFLSRLRALPGAPETVLTTNATLLEDHLEGLLEAGVTRINVSLDTLRSDRFRRLAGQDLFDSAWRGVELAYNRGLAVKINVVVLGGVNDDEILDFVYLTRDRDITVRFIEAMAFADLERGRLTIVDGDSILGSIGNKEPLERALHDTTAVEELYCIPGFAGRLGVIRGHTRTFCSNCSRLRINAVGQLRTCLYAEPSLDLRALLRGGVNAREIRRRISEAVEGRHPDGWAAQASVESDRSRAMSRIGG